MAGQVWAVASEGGYMYSDELSKHLRMTVQPRVKFRQLCNLEDGIDKGLNRGDKYNWNTYGNVAVQGGDLDEQQPIPETNFSVIQKSLTITEGGNSVPFTQKLELLAAHQVVDVIDATLRDDCRKYFDIKAFQEFKKTPLRATPAGGTSTSSIVLDTNGIPSVTNNVSLQPGHVKAIVDTMKERNIPPFIMDDYICVSHVSTLRPFKDSIETIKAYTDMGINHIYNGEIGRYEGVRFIEQNQIPTGGAYDSVTYNPKTSTPDPWNNNKSSWAMFMGQDTVAEAVAVPEEIRAKIPGDYGRSRGLAWYYLGGFGLIHDDALNARVVLWDSAA